MLKLQDRLYGKIELPDIAWDLVETCPVLLRLREVRMSNIPFLTHPSFANVDRYEHSVGVAHLAWRWARSRKLDQDSSIALTLAALYHDGATPGYGHLFEEFLSRFGFDHERALGQLLEGSGETPGGYAAQVFLGRSCKLASILPRPTSSSSCLTRIGIADLAAGKGSLGCLIKGKMDFDNIDNVIRAASAMGLMTEKDLHPYTVADAFEYEAGEVRIDPSKKFGLAAWGEIRQLLYDKILNNSYEFRAQSALKWAIEECALKQPRLCADNAWCLTDPMLTFEYLRREPFPRALVDCVRLGNPPELLCSAWLEDLSPLLGTNGEKRIAALRAEISSATNLEVYVNYYIDKRRRSLELPSSRQPALKFEEGDFDDLRLGRQQIPSGIVGVIGVSRVQRVALEGTHGEALTGRLSVNEHEFSSIFERHFTPPPRSVFIGWVGTQQQVPQPELFPVS
jgi:hypothetical protein